MVNTKIQVGLIEDDTDLREGLSRFLDMQSDMQCCYAFASVEQFLEKAEREEMMQADILLLDINLPGLTGTNGLPLIKQRSPDTLVVMLTINNDPDHIFKALSNGAVGYMLKGTTLAKIKEAIIDVKNGGSIISPVIARKLVNYFNPSAKQGELTEKELQVVQCLVDGLSYKLAASQLNISIDTVRFHIRNIYKKLQVNSKSEVVRKSLKGEIGNLLLTLFVKY